MIASGTSATIRQEPAARGLGAEICAPENRSRLTGLFQQHFDFTWRYLRRLGLTSADADDAAQRVFLVLARRLESVLPGREKSFLCAVCLRVASEHRRAVARRREADGDPARAAAERSAGPDELLARRRDRALLDEVLDALPDELRSVFVLFELEELETAEIATLLDLPVGTVASRLRRAREKFQAVVARMRARDRALGGIR